MSRSPQPNLPKGLDPETVAYWYFRLNGFLQIQNFIVHPNRRGSQLTDADLVAVRFPYRAERLFDNPDDVMEDDLRRLDLSRDLIDVVIAEVKTNQPCTLNGPWTESSRQNVHRVLAAIGCLPRELIPDAADDIYRAGVHSGDLGLRIRLVTVGRDRDENLATNYPHVQQLIWSEILTFIWNRFHIYRRQKTQVDQWDAEGKKLKRLASAYLDPNEFAQAAQSLMGVRPARDVEAAK